MSVSGTADEADRLQSESKAKARVAGSGLLGACVNNVERSSTGARWWGLVLWGLVLVGCGGRGQPPDVPDGEFRAYVEGTVTDTLSGTGHVRIEQGNLVGVELGAREGAGLSMELEPRPPARRTYEIVEWELLGRDKEDDGPPGSVAFLTLRQQQFRATSGTLEVTYVEGQRIGAAFELNMEETGESGPAGESAVRVAGQFRGAPLQ